MDPDASSAIDALFAAAMTASKASNGLFASNEHGFLHTFPEWNREECAASEMAARLLATLQDVAVNAIDLGEPESFLPVSDAIDALLDQVDDCLAEAAGPGGKGGGPGRSRVALQDSNLTAPKPQASPAFCHSAGLTPDNARETIFVPQPWDGRVAVPDGAGGYRHPFGAELDLLAYAPEHVSAPAVRRPCPAPLEVADMEVGDGSNGWTWVGDASALAAIGLDLASSIATAGAIAVDLEHHSFRSFQGLTCLLQLSTASHDYLVDCLAPAVRPALGSVLGPVFCDARVVKVLHGANSDVHWLQRDFGVYIVNLFDTGQASRRLGYASASLAHLLEAHASLTDVMETKKRFQTSDWRSRPLAPDMLRYARSDTHYLLSIYDQLRIELWRAGGADALRDVLTASEALCRSLYAKETFCAHGWRDPSRLHNAARAFPPEAMHRAHLLWDWRDATARAEDESAGYVLGNALLFRLARDPPADADALRRACSGSVHGAMGSPLLARLAPHLVALLATPFTPVPDDPRGPERAARAAAAAAAVARKAAAGRASALGALRPTSGVPFGFTPDTARALARAAPEGPPNPRTPPLRAVHVQSARAGAVAGAETDWANFAFSTARAEVPCAKTSEAVRTALQVRAALEATPLLPLVAQAFLPAPPQGGGGAAATVDGDGARVGGDGGGFESGSVDGGVAEVEAAADVAEGLEDLDDDMPRSMADTFAVPSRQRHRSTAGKALEPPKRRAEEAVPDGHAADFLLEIGWATKSKKKAKKATHSTVGHFAGPSANPYL